MALAAMSHKDVASDLSLRSLDEVDRVAISQWPPYPPPYEQLDYALRPAVGWIDTYGPKPSCLKFAVCHNTVLVAFTLLVPAGPDSAEFYVAVHPAHLSHGVGTQATRLTLQSGFYEHGLAHIVLRVRTNHLIGIHIYEKLGFERTGKFVADTNGQFVEFMRMELSRERWANGDVNEVKQQ
jgi:RimJ/RimL family protein N-acetyltransferase